jgi:DNA replication protein DnaC
MEMALTKECETCGGRRVTVERKGELAAAKVCPCATPCPACGGSGHRYATVEETFSKKAGPRTYEVLAECACRARERRVARYAKARLPGVIAHAGFENFRPSNPEQAKAVKAAQAFALGYRSKAPGKGFILAGPVGTGKTHLIAAALSHLVLEAGVEASYVEISLLYATIRRGFQEGKSGGEIIGPLSEIEVLAIDELGKGRGSAFELETLDELIARRYNAGRTTLFGTNYSLDPERRAPQAGYRRTADLKEAGKEPELLRERVGERIYSRLCEMCEFVELPPTTPDLRRMRHELR